MDGLEEPGEVAGVHEVAGFEAEDGDGGREVRNLLGIGRVVEAGDVGDVAAGELRGDRLVGGDHRLLDQLVRHGVHGGVDPRHHAPLVKIHLHLGRGDVESEALEAVAPELLGERVEGEDEFARLGGAVVRGGGGAVEDLLSLLVGQALLGADDGADEAAVDEDAGGVEGQERGKGEAVFARHEAAHAVGELFGQHRDHLVHEIDARSALAGLGVEFGAGADEVRDVGDVDAEHASALGVGLQREGVVEVLGRGGVDRDDELAAQIFAPAGVGELGGDCLGLEQGGRREVAGEAVHADDRFGVEGGVVRGADHAGDRRVGVEQRVVPGGEAHDDAVALLRALGVGDVEGVLEVGDHRHGGEEVAGAAQRADDVRETALDDGHDATGAALVAAARGDEGDFDAVAGERLADGLLGDDDVFAAVRGGDEARAAARDGEGANEGRFERRVAPEGARGEGLAPELSFTLDHLCAALSCWCAPRLARGVLLLSFSAFILSHSPGVRQCQRNAVSTERKATFAVHFGRRFG